MLKIFENFLINAAAYKNEIRRSHCQSKCFEIIHLIQILSLTFVYAEVTSITQSSNDYSNILIRLIRYFHLKNLFYFYY